MLVRLTACKKRLTNRLPKLSLITMGCPFSLLINNFFFWGGEVYSSLSGYEPQEKKSKLVHLLTVACVPQQKYAEDAEVRPHK